MEVEKFMKEKCDKARPLTVVWQDYTKDPNV